MTNHPLHSTFVSWTVADAQVAPRSTLIDWLCWNDSNGAFTDAQCALEDFEPLTRDSALDLVIESINQ